MHNVLNGGSTGIIIAFIGNSGDGRTDFAQRTIWQTKGIIMMMQKSNEKCNREAKY